MSDRWRIDLAPLRATDASALRRLVKALEHRDPRQTSFGRLVAGVMATVITGIADRLDAGELRGRP